MSCQFLFLMNAVNNLNYVNDNEMAAKNLTRTNMHGILSCVCEIEVKLLKDVQTKIEFYDSRV